MLNVCGIVTTSHLLHDNLAVVGCIKIPHWLHCDLLMKGGVSRSTLILYTIINTPSYLVPLLTYTGP